MPVKGKMFYVKIDKHKTHLKQCREHCAALSSYYLDLFNEVNTSGIYPEQYLNKKNALRELQYLCEYFKIQEFYLQGNPAQNW